MTLLILMVYILFACFVLLNTDKLARANNIDTEQYHTVEEVPILPKSPVKDSHWFIKTFLRNRKRKG